MSMRSRIGTVRRLNIGAERHSSLHVCVCRCPQVSSLFALCFGDMTTKTARWTIGIVLLCVVLLSAVMSVLWGIAMWYAETYSD